MGGGVSFLKRLLVVAFTAASVAMVGAPRADAAEKFSALIMDVESGRVMQQVNADAERFPASLTKMMTLYLAFDALEAGRLKLDQQLPVSARAQAQSPSKLGLRAGTTIPVQQAILGLVTRSANDAAVVLAEAMGGSEEVFAEMMTARARTLGMTRTRFRNASGLPNPNQVTTARDMATLGLALMHDHPRYYPYFSTKSFVYRGQTIGNHNHLLTRYEGTDGIKTGYTAASGFNLVASVKRDGRHLVGVVFGGTSGPARDAKMMALLDRSFAELNGDGVAVASARAKAKADVEVAANEDRAARMPTRLGVAQGDEEEESPKAAAASSTRGGKWGVQVGAFKKKDAALAHIRQVRLQAPVALKGAQAQVVSSGKMYRARLVGLTEARARETCRALAKSRVACVAMPPKQLVASR
jgi:D-alanyl-D-alanine carboxypeptidase